MAWRRAVTACGRAGARAAVAGERVDDAVGGDDAYLAVAPVEDVDVNKVTTQSVTY